MMDGFLDRLVLSNINLFYGGRMSECRGSPREGLDILGEGLDRMIVTSSSIDAEGDGRGGALFEVLMGAVGQPDGQFAA
jgi:hypothetical protein